MRPLLICDCDEVLLHMVRHFGTWLGESHDIDFRIAHGPLMGSMTRRNDGPKVENEEVWSFIQSFFPEQMHRQTLVPHAAESLRRLSEQADIVVLTNLGDHCREARTKQLGEHGIDVRVECNQGGKGGPVARLVDEHRPSVTVFVDDLGIHHESVAKHAPEVHRLHMVSEPELAPLVPPAPFAHARIDDWREATDWIGARFAAGRPAEPIVQGQAA